MIKYIFFILPFLAFSQAKLIEGVIIDSDDGKKIGNADIYFKLNSFGTISNDKGVFTFDFSKVPKTDTLIVSHLGYKEYKIKVEDFLKLEKKIHLIEHAFELDEVIISTTNTLKILKEAFENYDNNHVSENIIYIGSIKQVSEENKKITRFAYSDIFLKIPKKNSKKNSIIPTKKQYKKENKSELNNFQLIKLNQLANLLKIKIQLSYFINNIKKFDSVSLEEKKYGSYSVYEIVLEKRINQFKKSTISLIIEKESKGILSMKLEGDRGEGVDKWHVIFENNDEKISRIPTFSTGNIVFRPYKEKWILREINTTLNVIYNIESDNQKQSLENYNYVRILIDGIYSDEPVRNNKTFDLTNDIFNQIETNSIFNENKLSLRELKFITE